MIQGVAASTPASTFALWRGGYGRTRVIAVPSRAANSAYVTSAVPSPFGLASQQPGYAALSLRSGSGSLMEAEATERDNRRLARTKRQPASARTRRSTDSTSTSLRLYRAPMRELATACERTC
jgi:hypothetical protein